jgi:ATP-dependent Clp protease, protease subunit
METKLEKKKEENQKSHIDEKLMKNRTIMIYGGIDQKLAKEISAKLLVLSAESEEPIKLYINSQGGHVESGDTIFDMIRFCKAPVKVIGTGWVASAGALIYVAPPVEDRFCLPNTRFLIHQPMGGTMGSATDLAIEAKEIVKMKRRLNETIAKQTGQKIEKVEEDTDRNYWMSADEAKKYGIVGKIISSEEEL